MAEGKGVNEIRAAMQAAEAENLRRRSALREVRRKINDQYPNDPERQRAELAQYFDREERYFQEAVANWEKFDRRISDKVAKVNAAIQGEVITANETTNTLTPSGSTTRRWRKSRRPRQRWTRPSSSA
jgi:type I site-specific restriction-modification system R (restriction) subunit